MFVINVTNINEPPFDISLSSTSVRENLPVGQVLGELSAEDDDSTNVGLSISFFSFEFQEQTNIGFGLSELSSVSVCHKLYYTRE